MLLQLDSVAATSYLTFDKPVYGDLEEKFSAFVAPGMIAMIAFGNSIGLTALSFVSAGAEQH